MSKRRHVALFIPNFEAGGAERVMIRLAHGLIERGHQVDLLVLSDRGPYKKEVNEGINIINLGASRTLFGVLPLAAYLRRTRPKVLLSAIFHANFAAILARRISCTGIRLVISEHNTLELIRAAVNRLQWNIFLIILKATYPHADAVVCVSSGVAQGLEAMIPKLCTKLRVIGNPLITEDVLLKSRMPVEHPWLKGNHPKLVLAAGRLVSAKGFDILIDAFAAVVAIHPAKLVILGEGPERAALQGQIDKLCLAEHVCLNGFTDNPYAWMSKADLFVLSSRHEGLPSVLIEAMACGCKVVSTNCDHGPSEILEQGKLGRLVPVENSSALADAIVRELSTPLTTDTSCRVQAYHVSKVISQYEQTLALHSA